MEEKLKKSTLKHSIRKPILLNFVNLSTTFYSKLSEKIFSFLIQPRSLKLTFHVNFSISKDTFAIKIWVAASESQQKPKFDIFHKELFCTLASSVDLVLISLLIAAK